MNKSSSIFRALIASPTRSVSRSLLMPFACCALASLAPIVVAQTANPAAQKAVETIVAQLEQDGDVDAARSGFKKIVSTSPTYALPYYNLAILAESEERWDEAGRWLTEFVRWDTTSPLGKKGQTELERVKTLQTADATPDGKKTRQYNQAITEARTLLDLGRLPEAMNRAQDAVTLDSKRYEAYAVISIALSRRGYFTETAQHLQKAVELAPDASQPELRDAWNKTLWDAKIATLVSSGEQALQNKDYATSATQLTSAWRYSPEREEVGLEAATALVMNGSYTAASTVLKKVSQSSNSKIAAKAKAMSTDLEPALKSGEDANLTYLKNKETRTTASKQLATASAEEKRLVDLYNLTLVQMEDAAQKYNDASKAYEANTNSPQAGNNPALDTMTNIYKSRKQTYLQLHDSLKANLAVQKDELAKARQALLSSQSQLDNLATSGAVDVVWDHTVDVSPLPLTNLLSDSYLPDGTKITVVASEEVTMAKAKDKQQVIFTVQKDVLGPMGDVVIASKNFVQGHVAIVPGSDPKKPAYVFIFDSVQTRDGSLIPVQGSIQQRYPVGMSTKKKDSFIQEAMAYEIITRAAAKIKSAPAAPKPVGFLQPRL